MVRRFWWIVVIACFMAVPSLAATAEQVKIDQLKAQIVTLQNKGKLGIKNFTLAKKVIMYGSYVPLGGKKIKVGETLYVYFEPTNWFINFANQRYNFWIEEDMIIESTEGEVLLKKENAATLQLTTSSPVLDLYFKNTITDIPVGSYFFKVVLRDRLKDQSITHSTPFEVVP